MNCASRHGYLDIVKWFHNNKTRLGDKKCTKAAMDWAATEGHFNIVKFLYENREEGCTEYALYYSANRGHLNIVCFLCQNIKWINKQCIMNAIQWARLVNQDETKTHLIDILESM